MFSNMNMNSAAVIAMGISIACNLEAAAIMLENERENENSERDEEEIVEEDMSEEEADDEEEEADTLAEEEMCIDELMVPTNKIEVLEENNTETNLKRLLEEEFGKQIVKNYWVKIRRETKDNDVNIQSLLKKYKLYDTECAEPILLFNKENFLEILSYLKKHIKRSDTYMRQCIPVEVKLAVTLSFLTSGLTFKELTRISDLSLGYLSKAIIEVCQAIYSNMRHKFVKFPDTKEKWMKIANEFEEHWNFPLCLGALGTKHFYFKADKDRANLFYSERGSYSIILLALADAYEKFLYIDVGYPGRMSDNEVLTQSDLGQILLNEKSLPKPKIIGNNRKLPYVIVGGNSFPNIEHLLTPYNPKNMKLITKEAMFNSRLNSARHNIKSALGILSHRFKILQTRIFLDDVKTTIIVQACCVLHNFLIEKNAWYADFGYDEISKPDDDLVCVVDRVNMKAEKVRNEFREYFCAEGNINNC